METASPRRSSGLDPCASTVIKVKDRLIWRSLRKHTDPEALATAFVIREFMTTATDSTGSWRITEPQSGVSAVQVDCP